VQLDLVTKPNRIHRAEVQKLLVHTRVRRQGLGLALMNAVEAVAREAGRSLLLLDTREGDPAENLYLALRYTKLGVIPNYARSLNGLLEGSVFFYRFL
jgi:ribosomal protein S18 acetylase RimI-like enzyme